MHNKRTTSAIESRLDVITDALFHILLQGYQTMAHLDDLIERVAANGNAVDSAVTLLRGLKAKLDEAGADPVKLAELSASINSQTTKLAEAVVENTVPTPEPAPPVNTRIR